MNGWVVGLVGGWMDGWMDGWVDGWMDMHYIPDLLLSAGGQLVKACDDVTQAGQCAATYASAIGGLTDPAQICP